MKLKEGLILKIEHDHKNHYVQVISIHQPEEENMEIRILAQGKTATILREPEQGWKCKYPQACLENGLLEELSVMLEKCMPG